MNMGECTQSTCVYISVGSKLQMKLNGECLIGGMVSCDRFSYYGLQWFGSFEGEEITRHEGEHAFLLSFFSLFEENNTNFYDDGFMKDVY